jgi:hypothetical protein
MIFLWLCIAPSGPPPFQRRGHADVQTGGTQCLGQRQGTGLE